MSYGIQVYDRDGNLQFDSTNRLSRLAAVISVSVSGSSSVAYTLPGFTLDGTWGVAMVLSSSSFAPRLLLATDTLTVDNTTWSGAVTGHLVVFRI